MRDIDSQLFDAVEQRDGEKILKLLDAGADTKVKNKNGDTAIVCAVRNISDVTLLRSILKRTSISVLDNRLLCSSRCNPNPEIWHLLKSLRNKFFLFIGLMVGIFHIVFSITRENTGWPPEGSWFLAIFIVLGMIVLNRFYCKLIL